MNRTVVRFRTGTTLYAADVEDVVGVRAALDLRPLPHAQEGVIGLLEEAAGTVPVLDVLGPGREHVLLLRHGSARVGVHAETVLGLVRVDDTAYADAPRGQRSPLIRAVVPVEGQRHLVVDASALVAVLA